MPDIKYLQDICTRHQIPHSSIIIVEEEAFDEHSDFPSCFSHPPRWSCRLHPLIFFLRPKTISSKSIFCSLTFSTSHPLILLCHRENVQLLRIKVLYRSFIRSPSSVQCIENQFPRIAAAVNLLWLFYVVYLSVHN